jgi:hypothetical protein
LEKVSHRTCVNVCLSTKGEKLLELLVSKGRLTGAAMVAFEAFIGCKNAEYTKGFSICKGVLLGINTGLKLFSPIRGLSGKMALSTF